MQSRSEIAVVETRSALTVEEREHIDRAAHDGNLSLQFCAGHWSGSFTPQMQAYQRALLDRMEVLRGDEPLDRSAVGGLSLYEMLKRRGD